jgi:inner membrane protein
MLFRTHLAFAFLMSLYIIDFFPVKNKLLFIIIILFFAALPDIDESSSKIHKKFRPLSYLASLTGHRNIFHTLYTPLLFSLTLMLFNFKEQAIAILIGYLSHLLLDAITPQGISIFYPLNRKRIKGPISSGSFMETIIFFIFILLIIYKIIF